MRENVAANTPLTVSVSGTAPIAAGQDGGGGGADSGASSGGSATDNSQNPSVNSRADSGAADATTATATAMPARLDSLKWVLVAGFGALFALGLVYLWRRPANGACAVVLGDLSATVSVPQQDSAPAPRGSTTASAAAAVAEVNREVRGSLDELKDVLFRLELRRQAGTISEEDYARERARVETTLRDLVKG